MVMALERSIDADVLQEYLERFRDSFQSEVGQIPTPAQEEFMLSFADWYLDGGTSFATLKGYAGAGKSACLKHALRALEESAVDPDGEPLIWAAAPTHQATGVLQGFLGATVAGCSTLQSLLGLKPKQVTFTAKEERALALLKAQPILCEEDQLRMDLLIKKQHAALEQELAFEPSRPKPFLAGLRLLLVDECGMVNEQLFTLLHEMIWDGELVSPSLQVLFIGDPAQLPPVGESESLTFSRCNVLAELTDVVRYSGAILEYATAVRSSLADPESIHRAYADDDSLMTIPVNMAVREGSEIIFGTDETVRFICGTNARCRELNWQIRVLGKGTHTLGYEPGDELITTSAVQRGDMGLWVQDPALFDGSGWVRTSVYSRKTDKWMLRPPYGTGRCRNGVPVLGTSTYITLGENIGDRPTLGVIDAYLSQKNGVVVRVDTRLGPESFEYETLTGAKFTRQLWTYTLSDGGDMDSGEYVWLLDPNQVDVFLEELSTLKALANSTKSRAKDKRGQEGETAKKAWELLGLKNWERWKDGSPVSQTEFADLRAYLWSEYHALDCFVDPCSWSYAITCHRAQGVTIDIAVIDLKSITGPAKKAKHTGGLWDVRKSLYTAATRARSQVVIIE